MQATLTIIHNGQVLECKEGFWYIQSKPTLPFTSAEAAKNYINDNLNKTTANNNSHYLQQAPHKC